MKELFMFDIETAGNYPDWETFKSNDEKGSNLFESKYKKMNWEEKWGDIETAYLENAGIISTYGKIVCISFGYLDNDGNKQIKSIYGDDEKEIVIKFNDLLKKIETKNFNLSGFRILYFDIVWLLRKLYKYKIKPADIILIYDKKPWEIRITDIFDDWKGKFAWFNNFDELCYELGVKSPKEKMNGSNVHEYYWSGRLEEIKEYCEKDINSCIDISKIIYNNDRF